MKFPSFLLLFGLIVSASAFAANNSRSDTIDVLHQTIDLRITDFTNHTISGHCTTSIKAKLNNVTHLPLDLQGFTVDSVTQNGTALIYTYNALLLDITLANALNTNDTASVTVYYHGVPATDAQWGGFYWSGGYAYNLGVGFVAVPHTFGRAWFPCFDNFVERSTYTLVITTPFNKMAVCNGLLTNNTLNADSTRTWTWDMNLTIPSYLVCVSVNSYTPVWESFNSIAGNTVPVMLAALSADTTNMKNSFVHLTNALQTFEQHFGPYMWQKVGYVAVPFSSGAMEHASCISFPQFTLNGTTTYETIMAHELSHHWFGDLVTCETAQDMWLNEGWAVYCEKIFLESVYGEARYNSEVQINHDDVLHNAHINDSAYYAVSGIPLSKTYGTTVYHKGADVAHTLRSYMGDSLFFHCLKNYLAAHHFTHANSYDFRDFLSQCSGMDLTDFFNDWVFHPGFPCFFIDSTTTTASGSNYNVQVFVRQKLNHAPNYFSNVPLEVTFMNAAFDTAVRRIVMSGACGSFTVQLPFAPAYAGLDIQEKISDAVVGQNKIIKQTGASNFVYGRMNLNVSANTDSSFVRIEHRFAPPDPITTIPNLHISDYRYWNVDGVWAAGFSASATVSYNGSNGSTGHLDNSLITNSEDSLVLVYRAGVHHPWTVVIDAVKTMGNLTDKIGTIKINHLRRGDYALAIYDHNHIDNIQLSPDSCHALLDVTALRTPIDMTLYPSPTNNVITVTWTSTHVARLDIYNGIGQRMQSIPLTVRQSSVSVNTAAWQSGIYFAVMSDGNRIVTRKFAVSH